MENDVAKMLEDLLIIAEKQDTIITNLDDITKALHQHYCDNGEWNKASEILKKYDVK